MALLIALALSLNVIAQGTVTPYAPGVAERVLEHRIEWRQVPENRPPCLAATNDDRIGEYILVVQPYHQPEWCLVIDCAQPQHAIERNKRGLVLEVNYWTYQQWRGGEVIILGRGGDSVDLRKSFCSRHRC